MAKSLRLTLTRGRFMFFKSPESKLSVFQSSLRRQKVKIVLPDEIEDSGNLKRDPIS